MTFVNKVVLITGAASGIGEATALFFAKASARLSLFDINPNNLDTVSKKCEKLSKTKVLKVAVDVTKDENLKEGIVSTINEYGVIDIIVNCAGIPSFERITSPNALEIYDRTINVNLRAIFATIHFAVPALIESKGCIINISSVLAKTVTSTGIAYGVSKAAVTHFTKCVALELAGNGVRVNCISPGPVKTNLWKPKGGMSEEDCDRTLATFINSTPLKSAATTEEVVELIAYLASDNASSITGADFVIDSGFALTSALESLNMNK